MKHIHKITLFILLPFWMACHPVSYNSTHTHTYYDKVSDKYGFKDDLGQITTKPQYDYAGKFREGYTIMGRKGKKGIVDKQGKVVVKFKYDDITELNYSSPFEEGLAIVKIKEKWGFVNTKGKIAIKPQFDKVRAFYKGLATVEINGKWGAIDKKGRKLSECQYEKALVIDSGLISIKSGYKWGVINDEAETVVDYKYESIDLLHHLAVVELNGKYGYIDRTGHEVIEPKLDFATPFYADYDIAIVKQDGKYGIIDSIGHTIVSQLDSEPDFYSGYATISVGTKQGVLNFHGKMIVEPKYDLVKISNSGILVTLNAKKGFFNKSGKMIVKPIYDDMWYYNSEKTIIQAFLGKKSECIDMNGNILTESELMFVKEHGAIM